MIGKRVLGILGILSAVAGLGAATGARAQPVVGVPHEWQMGFPSSYTPLMERVASLHDLLLVIITLISVFVAVESAFALMGCQSAAPKVSEPQGPRSASPNKLEE